MAFKDKLLIVTNSEIFQLIYLFVCCGSILYGGLTKQTWICWLAALFFIIPLFCFFFSVFVHIVSPKYEESDSLLPPVMPPNFKNNNDA